MSLALDSTAHPGGGPISTTLDGGSIPSQADFLATAAFSTAAGGRRIYVAFTMDSHGSVVTTCAPFTVFWSDASGNVVATPSGASLFASEVSVRWESPYADLGQSAWYSATASSALTTVRVGIRRRAANTGAQDRIGGQLGVYAYFENAGGSVVTGGTASLQNVQDPPSAAVALRMTVTATAAGSHILTAVLCDNVNTALVGDTARASEAGQSATHGTLIEAHLEDTTSDAMLLGRSATSNAGTILTTTSAGAVTVGANKSDNYVSGVTVEVAISSGSTGWTDTYSETATPSVSFVGSQAMGASEAESASASVLLDGAVLIPTSQSESAQALDSYALALALSVQQGETATPGFSLSCSLAMGATYLEATSPSVQFDDGTTPPRRVAGFPFWPWWYRLHPYNRRRIM